MEKQTPLLNGIEQFTYFLATIWPLAAGVFAIYMVIAVIVVSIIIFSKKERTTEL